MTTKQSLADALEKALFNINGYTQYIALVTRVRELEAENAHNAHWHDHYGTLSDKLEAERDAYAKVAAEAHEHLKVTLETGGYVELHGIDTEALLLTPEEARDLRSQLNALELGNLPSEGWCTNCECDGCYTARRTSK